MTMATTTFEMEAMIHGYHVCATVWDARLERSSTASEKLTDQLVKGTSVET